LDRPAAPPLRAGPTPPSTIQFLGGTTTYGQAAGIAAIDQSAGRDRRLVSAGALTVATPGRSPTRIPTSPIDRCSPAVRTQEQVGCGDQHGARQLPDKTYSEVVTTIATSHRRRGEGAEDRERSRSRNRPHAGLAASEFEGSCPGLGAGGRDLPVAARPAIGLCVHSEPRANQGAYLVSSQFGSLRLPISVRS
jgi:hypothetical protein